MTRRLLTTTLLTILTLLPRQTSSAPLPQTIQTILESTQPLRTQPNHRLPLLLWPAHAALVEDPDLQKEIVLALHSRGISAIASWNPSDFTNSLHQSLQLARIQHELNLPVIVNANSCMHGFFNGSPETAHLDPNHQPFFEESIPGKIGCPFRLQHRYTIVQEQTAQFVRAYHENQLPLDLVFGDWEIDGPLEINESHKSALRCQACRQHIPNIEDFASFQKAVRAERNRATRTCYAEPILALYPKALVGNYGIYPNNGHRYWYDYFEQPSETHPSIREHNATYRTWPNDFNDTSYTMAMPVTYPWARIYESYPFPNADYRWFYNMLLVASNASQHTPPSTPLIPFVHYHTVFDPLPPNANTPQMSRHAYTELLWHLLLRGADSLFLWCTTEQSPTEIQLVHKVWSDSLQYEEFLNSGHPISHTVPNPPTPVISGLRLNNRVLIRRTDFNPPPHHPVNLTIGNHTVNIPPSPNTCLILNLEL
jgi:hypothetical protein